MKTDDSKPSWSAASAQLIPELPEQNSMILAGGFTEPLIWQPASPDSTLTQAENSADVILETESDFGFLRFVPASLLIPIPASGILIGSSREADLIFDDPTISKLHASITPEGDGWILRDLGSLNGTYTEEEQVREEPVFLRDGDQFMLAKGKIFALERAKDND